MEYSAAGMERPVMRFHLITLLLTFGCQSGQVDVGSDDSEGPTADSGLHSDDPGAESEDSGDPCTGSSAGPVSMPASPVGR